MRVLFIINPTAGANQAGTRWTALEGRLRQAGVQAEPRFTTAPGGATEVARQAAGVYDLIVAVGGDGTASEVADGLLSAKSNSTALAVMPFGTGNDFAAALGVRTEGDAIGSIVSGRTRFVDVIEIQCGSKPKPVVRHALLFAGVGIVSETLRRTTGTVKRIFGTRLSYPVGLAWALCSHSSPRMRIQCDARNYDERFLFVGASNTEIAGGGMRIAPGARIDDGLLNVNLVRALGRLEGFKQLRRVCRGQHTTHPQVTYLAARSLEVEADQPLEVAADGDLVGYTPARFEIRSEVLQVRVPQDP
jgi:diacylglycerol kinase (ATP)